MLICAVVWTSFFTNYSAKSEEESYVYTVATVLNGRRKPTTKSADIAWFTYGDRLLRTGKWSKDRAWIQVYGGEDNVCWVHTKYVSERTEPFEVCNENNGTVNCRKNPGKGSITGKIRNGETVLISNVIDGYGRCERGWVDLEYLIEEAD